MTAPTSTSRLLTPRFLVVVSSGFCYFLALAMLTLAYLPTPPSLIALEEPDHGIHPRLLRDLRDALYRLSYPESCGESRPPVQVIVTSHSPYLLDLSWLPSSGVDRR
jgi:predicted ATPase